MKSSSSSPFSISTFATPVQVWESRLTGRNRYISNIEMPGGKIVYVPMHPPETGATKTSSAADWTIDFDELERAITPRTKMIVLNTPRMSRMQMVADRSRC